MGDMRFRRRIGLQAWCAVLALTVGCGRALCGALAEPPETSGSDPVSAEMRDTAEVPPHESPKDPVAPEAAEAGQAAAAPAAPLPGPKLLDLRYNEDFSYLAGEPGTYREDFFDPVKYIPLNDDWSLSFGGEVRFRLKSATNLDFDAGPRTQDTFFLHRYLLHADVKYRKAFRVFVQGIAAFDEDRDLPARPVDENRIDLHQLFFDLRVLGEETPLTLRLGRQELMYGNERLVSPLDWANVRRRFDGVKLFWKGELWDVDFWYAKPVVVKRVQGDDWDEDQDFYGFYTTYRGLPRHGLDLYLLAVSDKSNRLNPNRRRGDLSRYTLGSRFWGKSAGFDYEAELAGQWGRWAGDTICAWSVALDGGYTFETVPGKPRIGVGFDMATGDRSPNDGKVNTFDPLYPLGHKYLGFLDLIGRQNVTALNVNLSAWPVEDRVRTAIAYHHFWLNEPRDALYNAAGGVVRRDPTGNSGRQVGHELDVTITWKIDVHSSLLVGYSHMWEGDFIINSGKSEDPDLFYVQYQFKF